LNEPAAEQEVAGGVTGGGQFRGDDQLDAGLDAALVRGPQPGLIPGEIPDGRVDLRQGDLHGVRATRGFKVAQFTSGNPP
jgi:hypothetical protein